MWFVVIVGSKRRSGQSRMLQYDWKKDPRLILDANWTGKLISEVLKRVGWKLNEIRKFCVSGTSYYIIYIKFVYIRQYNKFLFYGLGTFINQFPSLIHIDLEVFFSNSGLWAPLSSVFLYARSLHWQVMTFLTIPQVIAWHVPALPLKRLLTFKLPVPECLRIAAHAFRPPFARLCNFFLLESNVDKLYVSGNVLRRTIAQQQNWIATTGWVLAAFIEMFLLVYIFPILNECVW